MSRRANLPGAAELFRSTGGPATPAPVGRADPAPAPGATAPAPSPPTPVPERMPRAVEDTDPVGYHAADVQPPPSAVPAEVVSARTGVRSTGRRRSRVGERRPTGRERHDEKITVYVSAEELIDIEQARLTLRGEHGLAVDRGRIVREAVAVVLADLEAKGESSILVRRLRGL
jgi:hypothetical protein